jgi:hypothetical protein
MADETSGDSVADEAIFERVARRAAEVYGVESEGLSAETTIEDIEVIAVAESDHPFDRKFLSVAPALVLLDLENEFEIEIAEEEISDLGDSEGFMPLGLLVDFVQRKLMEKTVEAEESAVEEAVPSEEEAVASEEVDDWEDDEREDWEVERDRSDSAIKSLLEAEQERLRSERKPVFENPVNETLPIRVFYICLKVGFFVSLFVLARGHYLGIGGMVHAGFAGMAICMWFIGALFVDWAAIGHNFARGCLAIGDAFHRRSDS